MWLHGCIALFDQPGAELFPPKEIVMLQELRHRFACWRAYRQTLESLRQVHDSTLADNGIQRHEIRQRADRAAWRGQVGGR
jgi:uncharacterized protein YjiS (DUF1127 family)